MDIILAAIGEEIDNNLGIQQEKGEAAKQIAGTFW